MILNSYKKAMIWQVLGLCVTLTWFVGSFFIFSHTGKISWIQLALNGVFQLLPTVVFVTMMVRFSFRFKAAQKQGFMLCSRCEYPLASAVETQTCPECGCTRTITEHERIWKSWRAFFA